MSTADDTSAPPTCPGSVRGPLRLLSTTLRNAWRGAIFSESAQAAFWQTLSLPPLLLGLLGSLGYLGDWFGRRVVDSALDEIIAVSRTIFSEDVVAEFIAPTVNDIFTVGQAHLVSIGFVIALFAGSSAMAAFVDAITAAYEQQHIRNGVWQRLFALLLYVAGLALAIVGLPIVALGPDLITRVLPDEWQPLVSNWVSTLYYPTLGVLLVLALATLYKLALPRKLPWHRGLPGAVLAMVVFLVSSTILRNYLSGITATGYTYGAIATPIAFLLFAFFIGLAVIGGAYCNSAIQQLWPAALTHGPRGQWQTLSDARARDGSAVAAQGTFDTGPHARSNRADHSSLPPDGKPS